MNRRLQIAHRLLTNQGVIFISIDNNEYANLKLLCDQIFGENNFVTTIHVELSATQGMKVKAAKMGNVVKNGEFVLIYSKDGHKNIAKNISDIPNTFITLVIFAGVFFFLLLFCGFCVGKI